ncbi:MAG TPA: Smr/MutS family protein [Prolixibacteraceae bacterium]|nr:Smr/MutS family protein [Prolixibacteraceae bacterium]
MAAIYPDNFEQKIGFDQIRSMLKANCLSSLGIDRVEMLSFLVSYDEIDFQTGLVHEFLRIIREYDNFPTSHYYDLRSSLDKIRIEGTYLEVQELFDLKRSLDTLKGIIAFFRSSKPDLFPKLKSLLGNVTSFDFVLKEIDRILSKFGTIKDNASDELHEIRKQLFSLQGSISKKMQAILHELQVEGVIDEDASVAIRDGRPVIPVLSANKKKIVGIVHGESATGKTAFVEPAVIVEMNNCLRELENAERREIVKILIRFSTAIRPEVDNLLLLYDFLGEIDFIRCKSIFANQYDCIKPEMRNEPFFDWQRARHPLLMHALKKEKREVIPLNLQLDEPNRILLISGPNAGGKSVCLKSVGMIQYMLQCGLLVPVAEGSGMGIFDSIFIDIGDEQSIENDLSTYSSHLKNMKFFTQHCSSRSLVLIDEFGTGTEPLLGGAIAEAVLNKLNQLGTYGVITTHYTNLKHFSSSQRGIVNGAMLYDLEAMKPLFQLQVGKPGSSFAFEIARNIGLSEDILNEATEKLGKGHIDYDKQLRDIVRDKQYWENKRLRISDKERKIDTLSETYQQELQQTQKLRKEILAEAKREAQRILDEANKVIENTVKEIRESQAEKEKTREIRKKLVDFKEEVAQIDPEKEIRIEKKIEKIKQRENQVKKPKPEIKPVVKPKPEPRFHAGDKVRMKEGGSIAEIIDIDKQKVVLALGNLMTSVTIDKIEPISNNEAKKQEKEIRMKPKADSLKRTNELMEKRLTFKADIDVRGQRAEEALSNIQAFIDEAIMLRQSTLRILHGKGYGILKEVIRNYLKTEPAVRSFRDEQVQLGGAGITVVELE